MNEVFEQIAVFCQTPCEDLNYSKEKTYIKGDQEEHYAPVSFLQSKLSFLQDIPDLLKQGFIFNSHNVADDTHFANWYRQQFSKDLPLSLAKRISLLYAPDHKIIFDTIEIIDQCYQTLRNHQVIINNKNLPTQIGEWYAKSIFALKQIPSSSQRGFDFFIDENNHVEVKVHWGDRSSPKGVKLRKSLVRLSDFVVIVYVGKDFTIRDICFLDSEFVERKFNNKGHILFLKDQDLSSYFFSNSSKHFDKVANKNSLMKFASSMFAMKLDGRI